MSDERRDPTILPVTEAMVRFDMREGREWSKHELKQLVRALDADYGEVVRDVAPGKIVLRDKADQQIAQLGESMCAVHRMRPYTGWSELRARAERMLGVMEGLRSGVRGELRKVWVGCNVKLVIKREGPFELSEYLRHHKDWPSGEKYSKTTMIHERSEYFWFEDQGMGAQHKTSLMPSSEQDGAFNLSVRINVFKLISETSLETSTLDLAEERMRELFEETFTDDILDKLQVELREELR